MLKRQIIGVIGISLWAGLIAVAVIAGLGSKEAGPIDKAVQETIEPMAKDLVSSLASGDFNKATENFDETMKKMLPAEKLKEVWGSLIAKLGPFVEQAGTRAEKIMGYDVIFVTCKFERGVLDTKVVFNSKKQVAGLFFVPSRKTAK